MEFLKDSKVLGKNAVLEALKTVKDPDLQKDIVALGFVKGLKINEGHVKFTVELATPAPRVREQLKAESEDVVARLPGVNGVEATMTFKVTSRQHAQEKALIPNVKNTIAVASGKGGVGKSTVAANLASALNKYGAQVGLMDADVYGPSIPILMGASEPPQQTQEGLIPPISNGVKIISMAYFLPKDRAVVWRGPMLHKTIQQFLRQVDWGELDYLVIDMPPGTGDVQLSICQTIPLTGAVIVSTPQDLALEVASKAISMFEQLKTPILGIVENMSYYQCPHCGEHDDIFGHGGASQASQNRGFPFLGEIPLNSTIRARSDQGQPVVLEDQNSVYSKAFYDVTSAIAAQVSIANHRAAPMISFEE